MTDIKRPWDDSVEWVLRQLLKHEGGFVNHPSDPGGATNRGITLNTFRRVYGTNTGINRLRLMTEHEAKVIYWRLYIRSPQFHRIEDLALKHLVIDFAVHSGPARSIEYLREALGIKRDTSTTKNITRLVDADIEAIEKADTMVLASDFLQARSAFLARRVIEKPSQAVFAKGWFNRLKDLAATHKLRQPLFEPQARRHTWV